MFCAQTALQKWTWLVSDMSDSTIYLISTVSGMSSARDRCVVDRLWRQQSHIAPLADLAMSCLLDCWETIPCHVALNMQVLLRIP